MSRLVPPSSRRPIPPAHRSAWIIPAVVVLILFMLVSATEGASEITVYVNGQLKNYTPAPVIIDGRVLIPARVIFEDLNAKVAWDQKTKQVTISRDSDAVVVGIDKILASVNLEDYVLQVSPQLVNGYTYLPLAFFARGLGASVSWDPNKRTVTVNNLHLGDPMAVLETISGGVFMTPLGGALGPAQEGAELREGDLISTAPGASAVIRFRGGSELRMDGDSRITIEALNEAKDGKVGFSIFAWVGKLWSKVYAIGGRNPEYTIRTPTAVAGVRGTSFETIIKLLGETVVKGWEGKISMETAPSGATPPSGGDDSRKVIVEAGQTSKIEEKNLAPSQPETLDPSELSGWVEENLRKDQEAAARREREEKKQQELLTAVAARKDTLRELETRFQGQWGELTTRLPGAAVFLGDLVSDTSLTAIGANLSVKDPTRAEQEMKVLQAMLQGVAGELERKGELGKVMEFKARRDISIMEKEFDRRYHDLIKTDLPPQEFETKLRTLEDEFKNRQEGLLTKLRVDEEQARKQAVVKEFSVDTTVAHLDRAKQGMTGLESEYQRRIKELYGKGLPPDQLEKERSVMEQEFASRTQEMASRFPEIQSEVEKKYRAERARYEMELRELEHQRNLDEYIRRADQGDRTVPDQYENQIKRFEEEKEKILKERGVDPAAIGRGGPSPEMEAELRAIQSDCESRYKSIEESGDQADQGKLQALSKECSNRAKEVFRNYGFPVDAINEALDRTDMNLDFNQDGFGDPTGALPKEPPFVKDMEAVRKECEAEAKQIVVGGSGADAADALSDLDAKCRAKVKSIFEQAGVKGGIIGPGMDDEPGFDDPETRMPIELISALQSARKSCESRMNKAGEIGGIEGYEKAKSVFSDCKRTFESLFNKYGVPIPANPPWGKFDMPPPQEDKHNMDPNTGYPTGEYDPNRYDPNQDYYPKQDYDPNQDYYPKQDYDPNQDYDPKQDYNSNTDDTNDGSDTKSTSPPPVP